MSKCKNTLLLLPSFSLLPAYSPSFPWHRAHQAVHRPPCPPPAGAVLLSLAHRQRTEPRTRRAQGKALRQAAPGPRFCPGSYIYKSVAVEESLELSVLMSSWRSTSAPPAPGTRTNMARGVPLCAGLLGEGAGSCLKELCLLEEGEQRAPGT